MSVPNHSLLNPPQCVALAFESPARYSHHDEFVFCYTDLVIYSGLFSKLPNVKFQLLLAIMLLDNSSTCPTTKSPLMIVAHVPSLA